MRCPHPSLKILLDVPNWNVWRPPPNSWTSYQFSCQSNSTCISECGTPSSACFIHCSACLLKQLPSCFAKFSSNWPKIKQIETCTDKKLIYWTELQKAGILVSRIPNISWRESEHFQIVGKILIILGLKGYKNYNLWHI